MGFTASAVLMDTRSGFVYGDDESHRRANRIFIHK